jgi:hypothetical protein
VFVVVDFCFIENGINSNNIIHHVLYAFVQKPHKCNLLGNYVQIYHLQKKNKKQNNTIMCEVVCSFFNENKDSLSRTKNMSSEQIYL